MRGFLAVLLFALTVLVIAAVFALPGAFILMVLLGLLAKVSNVSAFALNFWSCYIIVIIIMLFFSRSSGDNW